MINQIAPFFQFTIFSLTRTKKNSILIKIKKRLYLIIFFLFPLSFITFWDIFGFKVVFGLYLILGCKNSNDKYNNYNDNSNNDNNNDNNNNNIYDKNDINDNGIIVITLIIK